MVLVLVELRWRSHDTQTKPLKEIGEKYNSIECIVEQNDIDRLHVLFQLNCE